MQKTNGYITTNTNDTKLEDLLFTYNEDEKQENEINATNTKHVFSPKFIPFYPELQREFGLTDTETKIFGFIDFYKSSSSERFYFTNEQLAYIANCNPDTVSRAISRLESLGFLKTSRRMRVGGGSIRFVTGVFLQKLTDNSYISRLDKNYKPDLTKTTSQTRQFLQTNKNKINKNKINKNKENTHTCFFENLKNLTDVDLQEIADKYQVPIAFVRSKFDDLENWHEKNPQKNHYKNYKRALMDWVKRDAIKIRGEVKAHGRTIREI